MLAHAQLERSKRIEAQISCTKRARTHAHAHTRAPLLLSLCAPQRALVSKNPTDARCGARPAVPLCWPGAFVRSAKPAAALCAAQATDRQTPRAGAAPVAARPQAPPHWLPLAVQRPVVSDIEHGMQQAMFFAALLHGRFIQAARRNAGQFRATASTAAAPLRSSQMWNCHPTGACMCAACTNRTGHAGPAPCRQDQQCGRVQHEPRPEQRHPTARRE